MSEVNDNRLVWVDIETTGLSVRDDFILEVACIITDRHMKTLEEYSRVKKFTPPTPDFWSRRQFVFDMHNSSGLLYECEISEISLSRIDDEINAMITEHSAENALLAGSTVHFDRNFLVANDLSFINRLNYRNFDVSTLRHAVKMWKPLSWVETSTSKHRALTDLHHSIHYARECLQIFGIDN